MSLRLMSAVILSPPHPENSERLLKQLLECVQECQKRYGGKTELATELDSCVVALCLSLEAVLLHGIKTKPQESLQVSTLKHVSDIVANSLHIGNENPSFWAFIKKHLTKHEQERFLALRHIWSDTGRGKAWIRSALNERSLERYFHTLFSNTDLLKAHYEDHAILRDDEKCSMLPNMAAGIASILFAISIDKPELNSGVPPRIESLKSKIEPIIEAPVSEHQKIRKKKKVARQFISFDEEESNMLSTSVPSTSSSISSDSNSEIQPFKNAQKGLAEKIDDTEDKRKVFSNGENRRKTSKENSGQKDKFFNIVEIGTLTPVSHLEIGELTPVSVEMNENFNSTDDTVEVPTDISEVLTAVEQKNKEEIKKKQDKIESLIKENEILKEQVKKYVGALQLPHNSEGNAQSVDKPDYEGEAKLFEKKLIQFAEIHAELLDFNVTLQQSLYQKDLLVEQLKSELEELRGPMPPEMNEVPRGSVNIWIPSAFLTGSGSSAHHVYQIFLRAGNDEWNIYRRYAQFYTLHCDLKKLDPAVAGFDFPPKKSIGKKDSAIVEDRRQRLQRYLRKVLAHWPELAYCNSRFLLEKHLTFFKDQKDVEQKGQSIFSPRRSRNATDNHYAGL